MSQNQKLPPNNTLSQDQEWKQMKMPLRIVGFVLALVVAASAFGTIVVDLLGTKSGWQQVTTNKTATGVTEEFILQYDAGRSGQSANAELKAVSAIYSDTLESAAQALSTMPYEGSLNLAVLNANPNQTMTIDPVLYGAFQTMEAEGSRYAYYAPLREQYNGVFHSQSDEEAVLFDPAKSEEITEYAAQLAAFASDSAQISVELLEENQVILHVSQAYLTFAQENELAAFVDFGFLKNAFLCDAVADVLTERGYTNGFLASIDGYTRTLSTDGMGLDVLDKQDGKTVKAASAAYTGPASIVTFRSFPVNQADSQNYFTYTDGTIVSPFIAEDGTVRTAASSLIVGAAETSVSTLALRAYAAFASDTLNQDMLTETSWIAVNNGNPESHGSMFALTEG